MTITINVKQRDPEAAYTRNAIAKRRLGVAAQCKCGEMRAQALIREKNRVICHECKRKERGMTTRDNTPCRRASPEGGEVRDAAKCLS